MRRQWLATVVALLLAGCSSGPVRIPAPDLPAPLVDPLPLRVGLVISMARRGHVFRDPTLGGIDAEVGSASAEALYAAALAGFAGVTEFGAPEAATGVDAVLELTGMEWTAAPPGEGQAALVKFDLTLSDATGRRVGNWSTQQRVDVAEILRDPGEPGAGHVSDILAVPATILLEKTGAALLRELREEPSIHRWLDDRGAYRAALPPAGPVDAAPAALRSHGVAVLSDVASDSVRRCIVRELRSGLAGRQVLSAGQVRRGLYPWLSDRPPAAAAAERLVALARHAPARARFAELGLGAVILVAGGTKQEWHGGGFCGAGYGGGGCLGLAWGKRDSLIAARLVDLSRPQAVVEAAAHRSGQALMPMFGLPLPFVPATQAAACRELGKALVKTLTLEPGPGN